MIIYRNVGEHSFLLSAGMELTEHAMVARLHRVLMDVSHWLIWIGSAVELFTIIHRTHHLLGRWIDTQQSGFLKLLMAGMF